MGCLADQRHAVVGFLAEESHLITSGFNLGAWKFIVRGFGFLQGQYVDGFIAGVRIQPVEHLRQAHGEGVDVPGGEFHGLTLTRRHPQFTHQSLVPLPIRVTGGQQFVAVKNRVGTGHETQRLYGFAHLLTAGR
jgi:hypothetical protein